MPVRNQSCLRDGFSVANASSFRPVAGASLQSAVTSGAGARAVVDNALLPAFGVVVAGGGLVTVPVYSNGTIWLVG